LKTLFQDEFDLYKIINYLNLNCSVSAWKEIDMKRGLALLGFCILIVSLLFAGSVFAAEQVTVKGKMEAGGTRLDGEDGKKYTVNASNDVANEISRLGGKIVELTGVIKVSHGRNIFTVLSYKALE